MSLRTASFWVHSHELSTDSAARLAIVGMFGITARAFMISLCIFSPFCKGLTVSSLAHSSLMNCIETGHPSYQDTYLEMRPPLSCIRTCSLSANPVNIVRIKDLARVQSIYWSRCMMQRLHIPNSPAFNYHNHQTNIESCMDLAIIM